MPRTSAAPMPTAEQTAQTGKTARKLLRNVRCRALSSLVVSMSHDVGSASLRPSRCLASPQGMVEISGLIHGLCKQDASGGTPWGPKSAAQASTARTTRAMAAMSLWAAIGIGDRGAGNRDELGA